MADIRLEKLVEGIVFGRKRISESSLGRLVDHSKDDGYIIVSACRHEFDENENRARTNKLKQMLRNSPFSYIPATGSMPESDEDEGEFSTDVREHSFVVFPRTKGGERLAFDDLDRFGRMICHKFGQDSLLQRKPGEKARYEKKDGSTDMEFDGPARLMKDEPYFTALGRHSKSNLTRPRTEFRDKFSF